MYRFIQLATTNLSNWHLISHYLNRDATIIGGQSEEFLALQVIICKPCIIDTMIYQMLHLQLNETLKMVYIHKLSEVSLFQ